MADSLFTHATNVVVRRQCDSVILVQYRLCYARSRYPHPIRGAGTVPGRDMYGSVRLWFRLTAGLQPAFW